MRSTWWVSTKWRKSNRKIHNRSITEKYENTKTVKLEHIKKISVKYPNFNSNITLDLFRANTSSKLHGSLRYHIHATTSQLIAQNKLTKWSPHELHKGSTNTKTKSDRKLAKIRYLLSTLFVSFTKYKVRIKIW